MSGWQAYADLLVSQGSATSAGIYDLQGNPWAYSAGFAAQIAEVGAVSAHMAADATGLAATGAVVAGVKYMFVSGDPNEVYVKKGNEGVVFCKCNTCILVAYHNDKIQPGACCSTVGKLADFLKALKEKEATDKLGALKAEVEAWAGKFMMPGH